MMYGVRINAYNVTNTQIEFQCAWLFEVPIYRNILPIQKIVNRLILDINCFHSQCSSNKFCHSNGICKHYMNKPHLFYCYCYPSWYGNQCQYQISSSILSICSKESLLIYDSIEMKSICICPLSKIGPTCRVPHPIFNQINKNIKCYNKGTKIPWDIRSAGRTVHCLCPEGYGGQFCQIKEQQILLKLSPSLISNKNLLAFIYYFVQITNPKLPVLTTSKFAEEDEISYSLAILRTQLITMNFKSIPNISIQSLRSRFEYSYYNMRYLSLIKIYTNEMIEQIYYYDHHFINESVDNLNVLIGYERCLSIKELFNQSILESNPLKRLKYYHQPCLQKLIKCFYDEIYLCLCSNQYNISKCYFFSFNSNKCLINNCQNQGQCLQIDQKLNSLNSKCLCLKCYNGKLCQYSTSDYSLTLDIIISEDLNIQLGINILKQTFLIQLCFYLIILFNLISLIFNTLTFLLFSNKQMRKTASGVYILVLSLINQLNIILFLIQFLFLIEFETTLYLCKILEYFSRICPILSDWLASFVTLEGVYSISIGIKFNKEKSKKIGKQILLLLILIQLIINCHELIFRRLIDDILFYEKQRQWCVISFDHYSWVKNYNIILNILNITLPFLCHLIGAIYILIKQSLNKFKLNQQKRFGKIFYNEFVKHKHLLLSPLLLILLNIPRLIFLFIFRCFNSSLEWQKYILLIIYFCSFMPRLLTFFLFVLTSPLYKYQMKQFFQKFRRSN